MTHLVDNLLTNKEFGLNINVISTFWSENELIERRWLNAYESLEVIRGDNWKNNGILSVVITVSLNGQYK